MRCVVVLFSSCYMNYVATFHTYIYIYIFLKVYNKIVRIHRISLYIFPMRLGDGSVRLLHWSLFILVADTRS